LVKVGWKKDMVEKNIPFLPISGWMGDNLLKKQDHKGTVNMDWWAGNDIEVGSEKIHVDTVYDFLDKVCRVPVRPMSAPMRMPISGIYKIKGVGDVLAGRVEQGIVKPGEEVIFLPTHTSSNPCVGKVFTVEMHHQRAEQAKPGDNVGLNIKGLDKQNMPRGGDVMVYKTTPPLARPRSSMPRSRSLISLTRSRSATLLSASCAAAAPPAVSPLSSGRWARRPVARSLRTLTP